MAADEDADVFEITDFTTASEWERFIARFEETLHEWKLVSQRPLPPVAKGQLTFGQWEEETTQLSFADFKFTVTHHYLKPVTSPDGGRDSEGRDEDVDEDHDQIPNAFLDMMSMDNDFPSRAHCLSRWYGLRDFVVISPVNDAIDSESRSKLLVSSVNIALSNTGCPVPVFVQILQSWRKMYSGVCVATGLTTQFDMVHLKRIPPQYNHLAGLLDVFKGKLGMSTVSLPPVSVSVRFTYVLQDWVNSPWPQGPPDLSSVGGDEVGFTEIGTLPFGACEDPVSELHLSCTWPSLSEEMIVDNQAYSDLDPLQAPQWTVRIQMTEDPFCLLGDYLRDFLQLCHCKETTDQLLGKALMEDDDKDTSADISQALQRLTEPAVPYSIPSLTSVMSHASTRLKVKPDESPIPADLLNSVLLYLFPDASPDAASLATEDTPREDSNNSHPGELSDRFIRDLTKQLKAAPHLSLTQKLAICSCRVSQGAGGLCAVAHLWQEFILEMRYRLENNFMIPNLERSAPNMGSCILHQKLQMLNCCIERKIRREEQQAKFSGADPGDAGGTETGKDNLEGAVGQESSSEEEMEFFECDESVTEKQNESATEGATEEEKEVEKKASNLGESCDSNDATFFKDSISYRPDGRLRPYGDLKLLDSGETLYIPITQEPAPMTEDMLDEHAEALAKLGTSSEGAQLRARMQSACLLSDMESFKAANPGCVLEDFVRWYSPRDYVEADVENEDGTKTKTGHLSSRMQIPGNMWVEVWQSARAVPARRQRRLFDDTKEAEKVLHFLSALKPAEVVLHLMPMLIQSAILRIVENEDPHVPKLKLLIEQITSKAAKATRSPLPEIRRYEDLLKAIRLAETVIARAKSLKSKFFMELMEHSGEEEAEIQHFVSCLLSQPEVIVRGGPQGPAGTLVHRLFLAAQKSAHMVTNEDAIEEDDLSLTLNPHRPASTIPDFPRPSGKEYILRTTVPRPAPYSRPSPQRMYCVLIDGDFRLAGAFTADTTFQ
ncbi:rab3 GTPase-activating protein catalytic subunit-like [Liolophura sinensis]|uniref:rab3 GTPase-activating protein catalytic subunit-like n=1 Tax=Liolophura sinensis TaxID=3198878 RepID=UPI0031593D39